MKNLQATKVWVLICSTLAIIRAAPSCNGFQTPYIQASTTPWWTNPQNSPIITSNQDKELNSELACISTNQNIFNILEESKAHCKGQDYRVTFYLQTDDDYTKLDSFLIDKHLFHNLLMKYSDWSLTSEKFGSINKEKTIKDDDKLNLHDDNLNKHFEDPLTSSGQTKWPIIVRLVEKDKTKRPKDRKCVCDSLEHQDTANAQSNTNNETNKKYHTINPSYNSKYNFYEVAVPEFIDATSSPKTINVYIDKNIKNNEYDIKVVEHNNSHVEERNKSEPEDQNASLKDFVKNHKISEIIDILFNDENVSYNKPILFDCNGTDTDIVNSDVKHIYSTGESAEYHKDVNGYFKNIDIDETISDSGSNEVCNREPKIVEILNSTDNYNNEYVITHIADNTVNSSPVRNNTGGVNNYYYKLLNDESSQATEPTDEGNFPVINTSHSVNVNPTVLSSQSDMLTFTQTSKEPNFFILPLTETKNTKAKQHIPCEYSKIKNAYEISCECNDKKKSDSNFQDQIFTPNYEILSQESNLFEEDVNNYSPGSSNLIQKPTKSSYLKALLDTENQKPFYTIDKILCLANPEDYPVPPQVMYSEPVPTEDTEFCINAKISEAPSMSSDSDTEAFHIIHHNITQEESKKPTSDNEILPNFVNELDRPISELSQNLQSVPNISSAFSVEPLADNQSSKTTELSPITQISPMPEIIPYYETLDITPSSLSTTSPSIDGTPPLKPFIKMSQLTFPQEDATLATIISFPQSDIISHLPEITETNKPEVLTPINPAVSPLLQRNKNLKAPKTISSYRTPFIHLKTSEPLSVGPVLPTILEPFSSFYSSNSQNMLPMSVQSWLTPVSSLRNYKLATKSATPKSDIPISYSIMEAIPELLPVQTPTISMTRQNLQPKFKPLTLANPQTKIYTEVPNASPKIIPTCSKEPLMTYPFPVNQMKPVDHDQEPYEDSWLTAPIQTNLFPMLNLPLVTAPSRITVSPPVTPSVKVSKLKYENQMAKDTFETIASPAPHKSLWAQKYSQPTSSPISSVPIQASTTSFYTSSPYTLAPPTLWQFFPKIQHLHSKPAQTIKPLSSSTPILLSDSDIQHLLPFPKVGSIVSPIPQTPIHTILPEIAQFNEQPTSTLTSPITYIQNINNHEPSFQKLHYHYPLSTDFLPPITQDSTILSHPTAESTENSQLQQQSPIIEPILTSNIASNIMTDAEQPTKPYVEPTIANQWTKARLLTSPSSKALALLSKRFPVTSLSSVLEPPISTYTSQLPETATPLSSTYPQLGTSYANNLKPILPYTTVKNLIRVKPSTVSPMLPTKVNVTPQLSKQAFGLPCSSLSYSEYLADKQSSLDSSFVHMGNSLPMRSLKSTINENPIEIIPESHFEYISPFITPPKVTGPSRPILPSTVSEVAMPISYENTPNQPAISNTLSGFPRRECNLYATTLSDIESISLKPISHAQSTVFSTVPVEKTKSPIIPTPLTTPLISPALAIPDTVLYTSLKLNKGNRQSISPLQWSEYLPIYIKPQMSAPQPIPLDNLPVSPAVVIPLLKEESSLQSPDSSTLFHIPLPTTTPKYSNLLLRTSSPNKIISPLTHPLNHPPTSSYNYQAYPSLLSPISKVDTKPAVIYKLSEPLNFVTKLSYASKPAIKNTPNVLPNDSVNFKEILPCKFGEYSIPLSPVTYYSPSEKVPKATPVWFTFNLVPNKIYPLTSLRPVKTITEPVIPLSNSNILIQTDIQTIPSSGLPSYTTPLLQPTSFLDTVSTAFNTLPLEETTSQTMLPSSLIREGKLISGMKPSEFSSPMHGIPLRPFTLTRSNFPQSKKNCSKQHFPSPQIQETDTSSVFLKPSTPIYASYVLESTPEGLKSLRLNNTESPKWRWKDSSLSSPTIPISYITPIPSDVTVSGSKNTLRASPLDRVSKPYSQSYVPTYKPVYTERLSTPIKAASPVESAELILQASNINKIKYTPLNYYPISVSELPLLESASYESECTPQIISPLQPSEMLNKPMKALYSNYPQSSITNKFIPNFYKLLSQSKTLCHIDANVPSLLPIPATPSSLPYRRPQISKLCQWLTPTIMPSITPTSATIDSDTLLPSTSYLSKGTKPVGELLYYPISEASIPMPATSASSASSILRTQNIAPSSPILPYTQIGEALKVMPSPSWYTTYSNNLKTPAITQIVYPTSTLSYPKLKPPTSNFNLASYFPLNVSSKTFKPQLSATQLPVNAFESIPPVKLLSVSEYKSPYLFQTPISPISPIFIPELSSVQSSPLRVPVYTTPLRDSGIVCLPSPKLSISAPSHSFAASTPVSSLKESSKYITPLQNAYPPQSISNSLTKKLSASVQPIPASDFRQSSSPNFSKLSPCEYAALNIPRRILPTTAPLNILQYAVPIISAPLSKQKLYEYKPTPYSVLDASSPITPFTELSSFSSTKPSLLDSAAISNVITSQIPLSKALCPESSRNLSVKPPFIKDTIPMQYVSSKIANLTSNLLRTLVPSPASSSYSVISNRNLLVPPRSPISPLLPIVKTPILPQNMKSGHMHNSNVKPISSSIYVNIPVISQRPHLAKFVSSTPYLQSICSSPLASEIGTAIPILPTKPSMLVETSLPKETHNIQSKTLVYPPKLIPPFVTPVPSYLPMPTSSSQTTPGRYTYTTSNVPVVSSPMTASVPYAPIRISDSYLQYYDPQFTTINSTPQNVELSPKSFTKYSSPFKCQSYYPSTGPVRSTKSPKNSQSQLPLITPLLSTPKLSPYKYIFPIKYGQFGLIYPAPQSKPCRYSDKLASFTTTAHEKPFTNYMASYSKAPSFQPAVSTMSSPPAGYPSKISAVYIKTDLPSVKSADIYDYTEYFIPESSLPTINLKSDDNFITPIDSSLSKTLSTSLPLFLSKLSPPMSSQLTYPQALPIKSPGVLSKYISRPVISSPLKKFPYYPSTFTATNSKKSSDIFTDSNTPVSEIRSPQSTSPYIIPASTLHSTPYNPLITSQNAKYYTPLKPLNSNVFPTPTKSRIAFNSKPHLNIGLSPAEVTFPRINTQFLPCTSSEYMTPESASLKLATNVLSPVPKLMNKLLQSLSYSKPRFSKTVTLPAQYVTPISTPVSSTLHPSLLSSSLLKPIYSKNSPLRYSPLETPVTNYPSYMPATQLISNTPVNSPLTHTPTSNYKNEVSTSSPLSLVSPFASQKPLLTSKGFSSLPTIQSSQSSPYSSLSSNYRHMPLTYSKYKTIYPKPMNTAAKDLSFQNSQFNQPYCTPLSSIAKKSSPLEPMQSIESLSILSPPIPTVSASSSKLPNYNTFQSLFKPSSTPIETVSGTYILPTLTNQFIHGTSSLKSHKSNKDNLNVNESIYVEPYYDYPTIFKTNGNSPPYYTATYPSLHSDPTSLVSKQPASDTNYFDDYLFKTYPLKPNYVSGKPISPFLLNQFYDKNSNMVSITNNFIPLQNEVKSRLYNYVKNNDNIKADVYDSNADLSIPLGNILVAKKDCDDPMVHTISPSIGLKVWPSNLKLLEAKLELKFKDVPVTNFQPVVNNLATHDLNELVNLIKSYVRNKYGEVIVLDSNNHLNNEYEVIKHCSNAENKCNLLWPVDTSCDSVKGIV